MNKEIYRHYGHNYFDRNLFEEIYNKTMCNKPGGGLWACPTKDVDVDWKTWSEGNEFALYKLKEHFDFTIKDSAKILEIKNIKDLEKLPKVYLEDSEYKSIIDNDTMNMDIDFEALSKDYDGMMVWIYRSEDLDNKSKLFDGIYYKLYGWDVDTLLVFNPNIIEEVA